MTVKIWSWRQAILRTRLESSTKLLLLALSTYMNDHGEGCYPSIDQICEDTSLSERTVYMHLDKAVTAGFLVKDKREKSGKNWAANQYRAALPEEKPAKQDDGVQPLHPSPAESLHVSESTAINAVKKEGVHLLHPMARGATIAPQEAPQPVDKAGDNDAMGCNDCSQGVQPLHPNPPKNSPVYPLRENNSLPRARVYTREGGVLKNGIGGSGCDILRMLSEDGLQRAKKAAPGFDIYHLAKEYNASMKACGAPDVPDAAFAGWCRKYAEKRGNRP